MDARAPDPWEALRRPRFSAPGGPTPGGGVDVWRVDLALHAEAVEPLRALLSGEEQQRAARLADPDVARRFVVRRGRLRQILARAVGAEPAALRYERGRHGRPHLVGMASPPEFSATDSADLALVAVARDVAVGVDVERLRPVEQAETIARRWLPPGERAAWQELVPRLGRDRAFLWFWTRLEARVKRRGRGIFDAQREGSAADLAATPEPWMFEPRPGFVAALCGPGPAARVRWWDAGSAATLAR